MNKVEVKSALKGILREMLLADLEADRKIPEEVSDYILESNGWITSSKTTAQEYLNDFLKHLRKYVDEVHLLVDNVNEEELTEAEYNITEEYTKYLKAESEYYLVMFELIKEIKESWQKKEHFSEEFKNICKSVENSVKVLAVKSEFLKRQFFLKLYGEANALSAHLKLSSLLRNELEQLKKNHEEILELNKQYDEIKLNKNFTELFKLYKELKKIESRSKVIENM